MREAIAALKLWAFWITLIAIAFAVGFFGSSALAAEWSIDAMNKQIDQTNFLVNKGCSGTLIDREHGFILTANHCVRDQFDDVTRQEVDEKGNVKEIKVRVSKPGTVSQFTYSGPNQISKTEYVYKVKAVDPDHDLSLLKVVAKLPNRMEAKLACSDPRRGDTVYSVGNPFAVLYGSVTKGIVASVHRDYRTLGIDGDASDGVEQPGDNGLIQHTAPIEGGNSGGALYDDAGELVGVNVRASQINETVALAVPLADIRAFLAAHNIVDGCNPPE